MRSDQSFVRRVVSVHVHGGWNHGNGCTIYPQNLRFFYYTTVLCIRRPGLRGSLCALLENSASTTTPDADWPLACWILLIGNWRANLQLQWRGPTVEAYVGLAVTGPWAHSAWTTLVEVPSFVARCCTISSCLFGCSKNSKHASSSQEHSNYYLLGALTECRFTMCVGCTWAGAELSKSTGGHACLLRRLSFGL